MRVWPQELGQELWAPPSQARRSRGDVKAESVSHHAKQGDGPGRGAGPAEGPGRLCRGARQGHQDETGDPQGRKVGWGAKAGPGRGEIAGQATGSSLRSAGLRDSVWRLLGSWKWKGQEIGVSPSRPLTPLTHLTPPHCSPARELPLRISSPRAAHTIPPAVLPVNSPPACQPAQRPGTDRPRGVAIAACGASTNSAALVSSHTTPVLMVRACLLSVPLSPSPSVSLCLSPFLLRSTALTSLLFLLSGGGSD